jgi:hypothetical protein
MRSILIAPSSHAWGEKSTCPTGEFKSKNLPIRQVLSEKSGGRDREQGRPAKLLLRAIFAKQSPSNDFPALEVASYKPLEMTESKNPQRVDTHGYGGFETGHQCPQRPGTRPIRGWVDRRGDRRFGLIYWGDRPVART